MLSKQSNAVGVLMGRHQVDTVVEGIGELSLRLHTAK
jgi:hypothetical protein